MNSPTLPGNAFLPRRKLSDEERRSFVERRDQLYSLCSPVERQYLIELAAYYESRRHELLATPYVFTKSSLAVLHHRVAPWLNPRPNLIVRALAKVSQLLNKVEQRHGKRLQSAFIAHFSSKADEGSEDVFFVLAQFFRAIELDIGAYGAPIGSNERIKVLAEKWITSSRVPASRRFDGVVRCLQWQTLSRHASDLSGYPWRLLLEVAQEDMGSALVLIDEHWGQTRSPQILMSLALHEMPELAFQLAVKFKPHRSAFAVDMLCTSIFYASFRFKGLDAPSTAALEEVMDASCRLLAAWTFDSSTDTPSVLRAAECLFRFGNPDEDYWQQIPGKCLAEIRNLPQPEQDKQLQLLAQIVFYGKDSPPIMEKAHELFEAGVARQLGGKPEWGSGYSHSVFAISGYLSVIENKTLAFRNRRVAACPDHFLLDTLEKQVDFLLEKLLLGEPFAALQHIASLALAVRNEQLFRKYHRVLREEFDARACNFPADAGRALKSVIAYCGYSQADDEMYRKALCRESFEAMLPVLEKISPEDAAIARTGKGWSPVPANIW